MTFFIPNWKKYRTRTPANPQINESNELVDGLFCSIIFGKEVVPVDLTDNVKFTSESMVVQGYESLVGNYFSSSEIISSARVPSGPVSIVCDFSAYSLATSTGAGQVRELMTTRNANESAGFEIFSSNNYHSKKGGVGEFAGIAAEKNLVVDGVLQASTISDENLPINQRVVMAVSLSDSAFGNDFRVGAHSNPFYYDGVIGVINVWTKEFSTDELISLSENPSQILKPQRKFFVFNGGASTVDLSGEATVSATTSATINASVSVVSASAASSTSNAAISAQLELSSISASISNASGQLSANISITAAALAKSVSNANIDLSALMQAQSKASAEGGGLLTADTGNTDLSATGLSSTDTNATLSLNATLSGIAVSNALTQANISTGQGLSANSKSSASGSGILLVDVPVSGRAKSYVKGLGGLSAIVPIVSSSASASNVTGGLNISANLSALALANALVQAGLTVDENGSLSATIKGSAEADAVINLQIPLSTNALASAKAMGALSQGTANIPKKDRWSSVLNARRYSVCA